MRWMAIRIALGAACWMVWSGCLSPSEANANAIAARATPLQRQHLNDFVIVNQSSTCLASEQPIYTYDNSSINAEKCDLSPIRRGKGTNDKNVCFSSEYLLLLDIRGGSDEYYSYESAHNGTEAVQDVDMNTVLDDEWQQGDEKVVYDSPKPPSLDDDNTQVVDEQQVLTEDSLNIPEQQQEEIEAEPTPPPSISASLKRKVTKRLERWKRRDVRETEFLDRMALVSDALLESEHDATLEKEEVTVSDDEVTHQSDLTRSGRYFTIVTTAALPWMTGTAVNPLLRAAHLVRKTQAINANNATEQQWVTLVVPWLELEEDAQELYGRVFADQQEQEDFIRTWLREDADMQDAADPSTGLKIRFYPARYHPGLASIFAMGDMCSLIPNEEADVCILEEPEHLNWYRAPGEGWTKKFHYVVGIVHTNYKEYASAQYHGLWTAPAISVMSAAMVRAYCHKVIKLSDVLQTFAPEKEETSNTHGVRSEFLKEGLRRSQEYQARSTNVAETSRQPQRAEPEETTVYFIGKLLWAKGLDLMLDLEEYYKQCTGDYFAIDIYGSGPEQMPIMRSYHGRKQLKNGLEESSSDDDLLEKETSILLMDDDDNTMEELLSGESPVGSLFTVQFKTRQRLQKIKDTIKATTESLEGFDLPKSLHEYRRQPIPATFPGRVDHALLTSQYKVFVNPSITEVLCTTTAEALAMGKFAIIPVHPSNTFFLRFPNCLAYRNKFEFVANLRWALTHEPEPLTPELAREFTWEAATDRLIEASAITHREALEREKLGLSKLDERIAWFHNELGKGATGDALRKVLGGRPVSKQVKYQRTKQAGEVVDEFIDEDGGDEDSEEDDDEGLPRKLRMSSFGAAIRSTVANGLPSLKAGGGSD